MKKTAALMVLIAATLWGSNGIFVKLLADSGLNSFERSSIRLVIAAIMEVLLVLFSDRTKFNIRKKSLLWSILIGIFGIFAFLVAYTICIVRVGMGIAGVLIYLMPSLVTFYGILFEKERLTSRKLIALALNLIGCALVSGIVSGGNFDLIGILIGVLTAVFYAFNNIAVASGLKDEHPLTKLVYPGIFAGVCGLLYLLFVSDPARIVNVLFGDLRNLGICIVWALCCSVMTYYLFNSALSHMDVAKASLLSTFEPVASIIFGLLLFQERLDLFGILGVVLVLVSLLIGE